MNRTQPLPEPQRRVLTPRQRPRQPLSADTELILPGWAQVPAARRHRLVSLLGELVRRQHVPKEDADDGR